MIAALALLFAAIWLQHAIVSLTYDDIPADVVQVRAYEWRDRSAPVPMDVAVARSAAGVTLTASARASVLTMFVRGNGDYLLDGPGAWSVTETRRLRDGTWRRTDRGVTPQAVPPGATVEWLGVQASAGPWPRCFRAIATWECWGIAPTERGVMTIGAGGRTWWAIAAPVVSGPFRSAAWGRVVLVRHSGAVSRIHITFAHPVSASSQRFAAIRLDTKTVPDAGASNLAPGAVWIFGEEIPPKAWMEIRSSTGGPAFIGLADVASGGPGGPFTVVLEDTRSLSGSVTGWNGQAASHALLTLFRLIDPASPAASKVQPRRVFAAETTSDDRGQFTIGGLGEADYELVAWHPQLGRSATVLEPSQDRLAVRLEAPGLVRGRVVSRGHPVAGVDVVSVPDAATFVETRDVTEAKGGDTRTGSDGRFVVMLASSGGGELRIGGGAHAVTRVPLPRPVVPSLDLGDVEIAAAIDFSVIVEGDPGCVLQAIGPIGRMGLQVVSGAREGVGHRISVPEPGLWQFALACSAGRRLLTPDSVDISSSLSGKSLHFVVR